ncbi:ComEC/Rec2 family competence protein [Clostridium ihumii]|uniref:ComEC/Rec2 family competence protein n=1 Tax=Clostridium ihumii TaxID=1470356 RepID=UPI00058CA34C|nr:ComEC/Rec2 family competence protein [Clostridium ihumii]
MSKCLFKRYKYLLVLALFCVTFILLIPKYNNTINDELKIHYINVGQGDGILIQHNGSNILIDGGPIDSSNMLIDYLTKNNVKKLDYIIATHPHDDHIGSLPYVLNYIKVDNFLAPKITSNTPTFVNLTKKLKYNNLKITPISAPKTVNLDENLTLNFISPKEISYDNINNYSIVLKLNYHNFSFLFTGDAEKEIENFLTSSNIDLNSTVLKIGHHGSKTSSTENFISKVNPKIAIISCGMGNDYGHPHKDVLKRLNNHNVKTYRTDKDGTVLVKCNKTNLKVLLEK